MSLTDPRNAAELHPPAIASTCICQRPDPCPHSREGMHDQERQIEAEYHEHQDLLSWLRQYTLNGLHH